MNQQQSEHRVGERASNGQRTSTEQANQYPTSYNAAPGTRAGRIAGEHCQIHVGPWEPASSPTSSRHLVSVIMEESGAKRRQRGKCGDDGGIGCESSDAKRRRRGDDRGHLAWRPVGRVRRCRAWCIRGLDLYVFHVWERVEKLIFMFLRFWLVFFFFFMFYV